MPYPELHNKSVYPSVKDLWKHKEGVRVSGGVRTNSMLKQEVRMRQGLYGQESRGTYTPKNGANQWVSSQETSGSQTLFRPELRANMQQKKKKKMQAENNHVWMQKSKAREGQAVKWLGSSKKKEQRVPPSRQSLWAVVRRELEWSTSSHCGWGEGSHECT